MSEIRVATDRDIPAITALLQSAGLPVSDLADAKPLFVVAFVDDSLVGVAGIERLGEAALVRSVAVAPAHRGRGVAHALVQQIEQHARQYGAKQAILLTQSAQSFFLREGYNVLERHDAPVAVQESAEFRSLCPLSAVCMSKHLGPLSTRGHD